MICEMAIRVHDKRTKSSATERKAGDVISLITSERRLDKYLELHQKKMLTQQHIDNFTDIRRKVEDVTAEDIREANLRWPWSPTEMKGYLIVNMDLTEQEVADLSRHDGYMENEEFVQTAFRKKTLDWDTLTNDLDTTKIKDESIEYQPVKDQTLSTSLIASREIK